MLKKILKIILGSLIFVVLIGVIYSQGWFLDFLPLKFILDLILLGLAIIIFFIGLFNDTLKSFSTFSGYRVSNFIFLLIIIFFSWLFLKTTTTISLLPELIAGLVSIGFLSFSIFGTKQSGKKVKILPKANELQSTKKSSKIKKNRLL